MKKTIFFAIFSTLICLSAESALLPSLRKSASTTKVVKEGSETTATISNNISGSNDKSTNENQSSNLAVLPDGKAYVGVNTYLSLRVEPFGKVSEQLYNNEEVEIINRDGDWYEVKTEKGTGWVYGKCIYDSPNSNSNSPTSEETKKNDDFDDGDYVKSPKDEGTYYYFTFENPGDYNFLFTSILEEDESSTETNTNTNSSTNIKTRTNTNTNTNTTNNSNSKVKTDNNSSKNKETTTKSNQETKNKSKIDEAVDLCYKCAWGLDAKRKQYGYPNGKRRPMYVKVLQKVYGNRNGWRRQTKMGASCDVAAAAMIR